MQCPNGPKLGGHRRRLAVPLLVLFPEWQSHDGQLLAKACACAVCCVVPCRARRRRNDAQLISSTEGRLAPRWCDFAAWWFWMRVGKRMTSVGWKEGNRVSLSESVTPTPNFVRASKAALSSTAAFRFVFPRPVEVLVSRV